MITLHSNKLLFLLWMLVPFYSFQSGHWRVDAFTVKRKHLAGIWKLKLDPANGSSRTSGSTPNTWKNKDNCSSLTIKLHEDGSFQQFDDTNGNSVRRQRLEGCWDYNVNDNQLQLAIDPDHSSSLFLGSPPSKSPKGADTLLTGKISQKAGDNNSGTAATTIAKGDISSGKSTTTDAHDTLSEETSATDANDHHDDDKSNDNVVMGKFKLKQIMSFYKLMTQSPNKKKSSSTMPKEKKSGMFQTSNFFGRRYVMKVVPTNNCKIRKPREMWDSKKGQFHSPLADRALYFQTMEIQFFSDSTFQAICIHNKNKILKGKFQVTTDDKLWFSVVSSGVSGNSDSTASTTPTPSLGSIHREEEEEDGMDATSIDDQRTYIGKITPGPGPSNKVSLGVQGKVTLGGEEEYEDFQSEKEPMGEFLLTEQMDPPPSADAEDDVFNSVFE